MAKKFILLIFCWIVFIRCGDAIVAKVGSVMITEKEIMYRARVADIYYPGTGKRYIALAQLIRGYLAEEVLREMGYNVDEAVLEDEARRIDENTKAPDILKKVKDIYRGDRKAYIKTFIRVIYAERYLFNEVFLKKRALESMTRPKKDYDEWFWAYASEISVKVYDRKLKEEFLREVEWSGRLKMN